MALLPPLADSVRMSATLGLDAHPSFYSSHVDMSATENASHVVLNFHGSGPEEVFQRPMLDTVELNGSLDSQEESPLPRVRRKRVIRRFTESSSEDEYVPKTARRNKSQVSYRESDSSSDGEGGHVRLPHAAATKSELPIGVFRGCPSCRTCQKVVATWRPDAGRRPCIEEAPVFYPNEEEFKHPLRYIATIRARAEPYGICRVVPPPSWKPPCPLRGDSADVQSMQFPTRVQQVHKLQVRQPTAKECSPTKQASKKRRGRGPMGRMSVSAACTPSPPLNDQPEYFGFWPGDPFPLGAFENYANDFKDQYFRISERQRTGSEQEWEPTVEMIEGEYWRIVEQATDQIEVLYGADVETGKFGSGFPKPRAGSEAASHYENSGWNLNNIARYPGSMLSFEEGDISGVLVPWLYIGMCFSSFCWHVEDHHFYSLNCMHWGAPKIWYGVPGFAADKLEAAMKKHLPDLFSEQPDLLHKLVTQLSPSFLKKEGVPVYRVVQQPGDFVITFPNAYHSGFNAGFNVAEAVNVAPVDWLPHGQAAVELYRELHRKTSVSHDKLLLGAAKVAVRMWWHSQQNEMVLSEKERAWASQCQSKDILTSLAGGLEPGLVSSWQAYCGEGGVLAKALKERVDMELARRESLKSTSGETLTLTTKLMDSNYDSTDERECEICKYDLHLSAVGCECCPDRFACLLHGHLLCQCPWSKKTLFYRYHLEQLTLLLAAVEGRPGAVANWTKQDSQQPTLSPPSPREALPSKLVVDKLAGDSKFEGLYPHTSSAVVETSTQLNCTTSTVQNETAIQSGNALGPDLMTQPFRGPFVSMRNPVQATASCVNSVNSPVHQESNDVSSHPQRPVFLRSGHARSIARKDSPELAVSNGFSKKNFLITELVNSARPPASSPSENPQHVNASKAEVILLSDDEEEVTTCKLNEAVEPSFSAHEVPSNYLSRATECATERKTEGDASHGYVEAVAVGANLKQLASTVMVVRSPITERAVHAPLSAGTALKLESERPEELITIARPLNDLVTVVQRGTSSSWTPHRVARVRVKREVDLIHVGRLMVREGWQSRQAIFPAGFKSRVRYINVEDVFKTCIYVSEIIDRGLGARPLFQVTHPTKREVYLHDSIDGCWHEIQNQINEAIIARRSDNSNVQLPPLLPPPSGLEMFGLASTSIIEAVEALDPFHQCLDYWGGKQSLNQRPGIAEHEIRRAGAQRPDLAELEFRRAGIQRPYAGEPEVRRAGIQRPDVAEPEVRRAGIQRPDVAEPEVRRVGIQRPDVAEPEVRRAGIQRPDVAEPEVRRSGIQRPDLAEHEIRQAGIQRPDLAELEFRRAGIQRPDAAGPEIRRGISVGRLKEEALEQPLRVVQDRVPQSRIVNTNSRPSVNISSTKANGSQVCMQEINPVRQGILPNPIIPTDRNQNADSILQGLFQRATPAELTVMYRVFTSGTQGTEWRTAFRALTEEIQKRFL
ncbi:hypothetical protein M758_5G036600 [Ceratodon purpureus]|nr:hypothetical protein M758_5G036600 [Ceratodon purpureus]